MADFTSSLELLGRNLKRIRALLAWSQQKLAEKCNLSTNFISELEGGKVWISSETLDTLCGVLGVEQYRLFLPESILEISTDEAITACLKEIEDSNKKAIAEVREKYVRRIDTGTRGL